jgi:hypothetical protein
MSVYQHYRVVSRYVLQHTLSSQCFSLELNFYFCFVIGEFVFEIDRGLSYGFQKLLFNLFFLGSNINFRSECRL